MQNNRDTTGTEPPAPRSLRMFHRVLPADVMAVRHALMDMRERFAGQVPEDPLDRIELVLAEVLNNIVHHGRITDPKPAARPHDHAGTGRTLRHGVTIHLTVTCHDGGLACAVSDNGVALPLELLTSEDVRPTPEAAAMRDGGFGWLIIRDLARSLFYFREDDRNVLCFNIPRADPARRDPLPRPSARTDVA